MASILFRMMNSFAKEAPASASAHMRGQFIARGIVPAKAQPYTRHFWGIVEEPGTR
jgi:hypothetical protein